ncbi:hypothetical protein Cdeb_01930 [Caldibacillus debilis GB1]|uniref:Uncharacterized protein n=1 Tax=Caldibacillus debilis GB1 TaxID=1339248 RepID=A0A420VBU1_9BACI|nr:hypothetical protein Cdeb_01930 [Caldibacillus debilis GB1]
MAFEKDMCSRIVQMKEPLCRGSNHHYLRTNAKIPDMPMKIPLSKLIQKFVCDFNDLIFI